MYDNWNRGAVASAVPGATTVLEKPVTFHHPTWAVKKLLTVTKLEEVRFSSDQTNEEMGVWMYILTQSRCDSLRGFFTVSSTTAEVVASTPHAY